jgi:hypothetical protein
VPGLGRDEHVGSTQMGEHCLDNRLAAIGYPCRVRAQLQAGAPIGQPEAAKAQEILQLDGVLSPGLIPERVVGKGGCGYLELVSHENDRTLAGPQTLARMPQEAQLNGEPKSVDGAPLGPDERQILGAEHVVLCHLGGIDRNGEQAGALLGRQQGAAGHEGLVLMGRGRS